jgi:hypothetical protein
VSRVKFVAAFVVGAAAGAGALAAAALLRHSRKAAALPVPDLPDGNSRGTELRRWMAANPDRARAPEYLED